MDIREALLKEHSKKQSLKIAAYIGDDKKKFATLVNLVIASEEVVSQRGAWVMSISSGQHPELLEPHLGKLIGLLEKKVHAAVKRNITRVLQSQEISERLQGRLVEALFNLLQSPVEPIAIKAFSMTVLLNICRLQPELKHELSMVIEDLLPFAGAGIRARAKKVLKELNRI